MLTEGHLHNAPAAPEEKASRPAVAVEPVPLQRAQGAEVPRPRFIARVWKLVLGLAEGGRMVRLVGPGTRPEERYEFERREFREWTL